MNCCQCQGIEEVFSQPFVTKELSRYRVKGPIKTTRMLIDAIKAEGVDGLTLLDIGGGVGAVEHELLDAGVNCATDVDASQAYINAARDEAQRKGYVEKVSYHYGNFVELAEDIGPADIVTLDRVICCFDDMERLVGLSAERARKLYGLVYPRDTWLMKIGIAIMNFFLLLRRSPYRSYFYQTKAVEAILRNNGFKRRSFSQTMAWQVAVYAR